MVQTVSSRTGGTTVYRTGSEGDTRSNIVIKMIVRVFWMILFLPESTEGISAGQTTALIQDVVQDNSSDTIYSGNKEADDERIHEDISV